MVDTKERGASGLETATPPPGNTADSVGGGGPVIALEALVKRFGRVRALDGLTASVPAGPVGLLGPNGAGKTTLIKLLLGLLQPTSGKARIAGRDPESRADRIAVRRVVGYMPESDCLIPGRTGIELVATLGRITGLATADAMTRAHEVLDYVGLEDQRYRPLDQYSTGMKQRLKLAQALVHDPDLLLLDEPTNGLDPKGRRHMLELVHDLGHEQGKSLLLCSHLLPDVERTCTDVVVIHRGRTAAAGNIAELTSAEDRRLDVVVREDEGGGAFETELSNGGVPFTSEGPGHYRLSLAADEESADRVFCLAERARCAVLSIEPVRSSLEEVFLEVLRDSETESERDA
jgi:ABC-2 type transport system ATP-binding protein